MKHSIFILFFIVSLLFTLQSYGAVTSHGEINVAGETKGIVPASSTASLVVTLSIDRSLAEPGEEIKTIEIIMPAGFVPQLVNFKSILRDGAELKAGAVFSGNTMRVELEEPITDSQNSIYEIAFDSRTPSTFFEAVFRIRLRNPDDSPIGEFIKPGPADSKQNNDDLTLQVIPNVPPDLVLGFTAEADKTGENDVTLRWQKSTDLDVSGYLIYRDKDFQIDVNKREATTFRDVNVPPGSHTYEITAYKIKSLQSERSPIQTVNVLEDVAAPEPPTALRIVPSTEGVEVLWKASVSRDVSMYRILFGTSESETLEPLPDREILTPHPDDVAEGYTHRYVHRQPLSVGSFTYAVVAIDEADNESEPAKKRLRLFDKPFPNPFTPLSQDPDFNTVVFPARSIEDGVTPHPDDVAEGYTHRYVHRQPLSVGSFTYAVVAIDEADNESEPAKKRLRLFDKPFPNPFTPLSQDPDFNTVVFSERSIEDGEGEFSVLLFNLNGVLVKNLSAQLGETELRWNGKNENGEIVESGIYIYQLQVGDSFKTGTIIVAK